MDACFLILIFTLHVLFLCMYVCSCETRSGRMIPFLPLFLI